MLRATLNQGQDSSYDKATDGVPTVKVLYSEIPTPANPLLSARLGSHLRSAADAKAKLTPLAKISWPQILCENDANSSLGKGC